MIYAALLGSIATQENFGEEEYTTCNPSDPHKNCRYSSEGGCCMTYVLESAAGELDSDWEGLEIGQKMNECVSFHEMDFLLEYGKGQHSVYQNNEFYYNHVSKAEFFEDMTKEDEDMTFEEWYAKYSGVYKGISGWKDTMFSLDCKEKGDLATALKVGYVAAAIFGTVTIY